MHVGDDGQDSTSSLRREWSRAFVIMLALLLVSAIIAIVGVWHVVGQVRGTARTLRYQTSAIASLQTNLIAHEEVGHLLLSDEPVNRAAFVEQQLRMSTEFTVAATLFPAGNGMKGRVMEAAGSWQAGLREYGLWGDEALTIHGDHAVDNPTFGSASDHTDALVDGLQGPSLLALDRGLADGDTLKRYLVLVLAGLFGLALAVTVYFRRRMARDFLRPITKMHKGVLQLQDGRYDSRIDVGRRDELGELTEAFNDMAGALHDSHEALSIRATHDALTGLPNRSSLTERLTASFVPGRDRRTGRESVLFVDVDDFKEINDSLGHAGGDALLVQLANRLNVCVRPNDLVARLGGDEFAIVVGQDADGSRAVSVADRVLAAMRVPFVIGGARTSVSVSIGVAPRDLETADVAELLRHADFAMYMAKGSGKGRYQLFDSAVHDQMVGRSALKAELAVAVESGQLRLAYQPVFELLIGQVVGVEALVRWEHPTLGVLAPADFIALAEETGDIDAIGAWVLATATSEASAWRRDIDGCENLWVAVNLSPFQLAHTRGVDAIRSILADPVAQADKVVLEDTETTLAADIGGAVSSLNTLKALGVRVAIDDFGSGFSSLSTLASLPVDILKIDRSFVSGHDGAASSGPMLEGILGLAGKLSLTVIAEGVEETDQLDLLRRLGCEMGQGFLLGRPVSAEALGLVLASRGWPRLVEPAMRGRAAPVS